MQHQQIAQILIDSHPTTEQLSESLLSVSAYVDRLERKKVAEEFYTKFVCSVLAGSALGGDAPDRVARIVRNADQIAQAAIARIEEVGFAPPEGWTNMEDRTPPSGLSVRLMVLEQRDIGAFTWSDKMLVGDLPVRRCERRTFWQAAQTPEDPPVATEHLPSEPDRV